MNTLDDATLDGMSNGEGFRLIAEVSRQVIDNTDFDLTETTTCDWPNDSMVRTVPLGNTLVYGLTEVREGYYQTTPYFYKIIWLNNNDSLSYTTDMGCVIFFNRVPAHNILNHEFGHLVGLNHHGWWPFDNNHTAMKPGCNSGQAQIRAEDINDINDYYR